MPKVSIVLAVYNGERYVQETVQSVLSQTMKEFELIIIDDGSSDRTEEIIKGIDDHRIRYVRQVNGGQAVARNAGCGLSNAPLIAIIDHDDLWLPQKLEWQLDYMEHNPYCVLLGGEIHMIDKDNNYLYTVHKPHSDEENRHFLDVKNMWTHAAVMFRKESFEAVGGYFESRHVYFEDYMLMYQLSKVGRIAQLDRVVTKYRVHPYAISAKTEHPDLTRIMMSSLSKGYVSEEDQEILREIKQNERANDDRKEGLYHLFLGRSFMFHRYRRKESRAHLKKCIKLIPDLKIARIYLFMVTFLPKWLLDRIYQWRGPMYGFISVEENEVF
jgi:glycosyltransferase involved in cell wall biosynthesis